MGDVNGNYKNIAASTTLRSNDGIIMDMAHATIADNKMTIPVMVNANFDVNSVDFSIKFNEDAMTFVAANGGEQSLSFFNENDRTLRFTSNSLNAINMNAPVAFVTFALNNEVTERDFVTVGGYLNGDKVNFEVLNSPLSVNEELRNTLVYPNPTSSILNIVTDVEASVEVIDMSGRKVLDLGKTSKSVNTYDVSNLINGVYSVRLTSGSNVEVKKIFVTK